jgi:hypothetical protein
MLTIMSKKGEEYPPPPPPYGHGTIPVTTVLAMQDLRKDKCWECMWLLAYGSLKRRKCPGRRRWFSRKSDKQMTEQAWSQFVVDCPMAPSILEHHQARSDSKLPWWHLERMCPLGPQHYRSFYTETVPFHRI